MVRPHGQRLMARDAAVSAPFAGVWTSCWPLSVLKRGGKHAPQPHCKGPICCHLLSGTWKPWGSCLLSLCMPILKRALSVAKGTRRELE